MASCSGDRSAQAAQIEIFRAMPPWRKLELLDDSCQNTRALLEAGLRFRFPDSSDAEIQLMVLELILGEEMALRIRSEPLPAT